MTMVFENIEKLKQDFTDKYVVVDASRPELRRFQHLTGVVKTVNMNGRALVEFKANENTGWYDIELDFLQVVDKPQVVEPAKKEAAKPAPKPAAKPAAVKPAAKAEAKAGGAGMSVADILAAARGGSAPAAKPAAAKPPSAKPDAPAPAAKATDAKKMSVAEILAAARGESAPAPAAQPAAAPEPEPVEEAPAAEAEVVEEPPAPPKPSAAEGPLPQSVPDIIEFCRKRDG